MGEVPLAYGICTLHGPYIKAQALGVFRNVIKCKDRAHLSQCAVLV